MLSRVRIEYVDGRFVYAGGRGLVCIGNKPVSVGDYVWTDGKVVFGNEQESEQPKVITAQEDESIPIMIGKSLYTFEKNRLKKIAEIKNEQGKMNLYNVVGDKLKLSYTLPNTDKWTNFPLMINDNKKTAWLYDDGTHYKTYFYGRKNDTSGEMENFWTDTELIASNIDKRGNRFDMILRYKSKITTETIFDFVNTDKQVKVSAIEILKNSEVVKSVSTQSIADEISSLCPGDNCTTNLDPLPIGGFHIYAPFIEDDQSWYVFLHTETLSDAWDIGEDVNHNNAYEQYQMVSLHMLTPKGLTKIYVGTSLCRGAHDFYTFGDFSLHWKAVSGTAYKAPKTIIPLQDGYYYEIRDIFCSLELFDVNVPVASAEDSLFAYITFYSPSGKELSTGIAVIPVNYPICKVKGKHLLSITGNALFLGNDTPDTYNGVRVLRSGLYLISGEHWKRLGDAISNERLRPMKKIHGWQKHLKLIEMKQKEI